MSVASLEVAVETIDGIVSALDLASITCGDAARLVSVFIKGERICHAGKALAAQRASEGRIHFDSGFRDPSSWLAEKSGEPVHQARAELETASLLKDLDETDRAFRAGKLSAAQAQTIADAAAADPRAEGDLLERARTDSLRELRDQCERVKAAVRSADAADARYERIRRERFLRVWNGSDGATKGQFSLTPDAGARLLATLQPWADRFFEEARRGGRRESTDAYMADALMASVTGALPLTVAEVPNDAPGGDDVDVSSSRRRGDDVESSSFRRRGDHARASSPRPNAGAVVAESGPDAVASRRSAFSVVPGEPRRERAPAPATVICRVDLAALRRGEMSHGEICEIPGVGPIPVSTARELLTDCFLKLVITDGVDVRTVAHYGRTLTAHQRTALEYRDPYCVVPGCGRSFGLENDHIADFALGGPTSLENLCRLCQQHHALKTHRGYRIRGGPGTWEWVAPAGDDRERLPNPGSSNAPTKTPPA